jgi:hypothetical protein
MTRNKYPYTLQRRKRKTKREPETGYIKKTYLNGNVYEGVLKNDKRLGFGIMKYTNGDIYRGTWRNNMYHGRGKLITNKGEIYEGEWVYGKKTGFGKIKKNNIEYEGNFNNDNFDGYGRGIIKQDHNNNQFWNKYTGNWRNGKGNGRGEMILENGDKFIGNWKDGLLDGFGIFISGQNQEFFEGIWENGLMKEGYYIFPNGEKFTGSFYQDFPNNGKLEYSNGDIYEGILDSKIDELIVHNGFGAMSYTNKDYYEGFWMNGFKHGLGVYYYANGDKYAGEWYLGKKRGIGTYTYANGKIVSGNFDCDMYQISDTDFFCNREENDEYTKITIINRDHENELDVHPKVISSLYPNINDTKRFSIYIDKKTNERFLQVSLFGKLVNSFKIDSTLSNDEIFVFIKNIDNIVCTNWDDLSEEEQNKLKCPISMDIIFEPITLSACKHTFDKININQLIFASVQKEQLCPLCRKKITNYYENIEIKNTLKKCVFSYKGKIIENELYHLLKINHISNKPLVIKQHDPNAWINDVEDVGFD